MRATIIITGRRLYDAYNTKRSQPWEYAFPEGGPESRELGTLRSIRRHIDGTYTVTGTRGARRATAFPIYD